MLTATTALAVLALSVGANDTSEVEQKMPTRIADIAITINGRDAYYERATDCSAYFYRLGVMGRINACHAKWRVTVDNHSNTGARIRVSATPAR